MKARFVSFNDGCLPGVTTGVEMAGWDDEFGRGATVRTRLVRMREIKLITAASLPAPISNTL